MTCRVNVNVSVSRTETVCLSAWLPVSSLGSRVPSHIHVYLKHTQIYQIDDRESERKNPASYMCVFTVVTSIHWIWMVWNRFWTKTTTTNVSRHDDQNKTKKRTHTKRIARKNELGYRALGKFNFLMLSLIYALVYLGFRCFVAVVSTIFFVSVSPVDEHAHSALNCHCISDAWVYLYGYNKF